MRKAHPDVPIFTAALDRYKAGEAISREGGARKIIDDLTAMDAEYLAAVERGDMVTAQRMVDDAAANAGYDITMWHATKNTDFTAFEKGSWFAFDWRDSQPFGLPKRFYLNPQNIVNNAKSAPANGEFA